MQRRCFLFLQGPQSRFFRRLGLTLLNLGHKVIKINFCGGDVWHWPWPCTLWYQNKRVNWPFWVKNLMQEQGVTDILLFGDRRPMHRDALILAQQLDIQTHIFEEGYLRPAHITMENGGVNGCSKLPQTPEQVRQMATGLSEPENPAPVYNPLKKRVMDAVWHHVGNTVLFPLFPLYKTHRPYTIGWELQGWIPRFLNQKKRQQKALDLQKQILDQKLDYFLFPLQLDSDFQVRLYSDFASLTEAIMHVLSSFSRHAANNSYLVVKNHPLDNGLINYQKLTKLKFRKGPKAKG